jgi:predicted membrane-bound mannosyltransferase
VTIGATPRRPVSTQWRIALGVIALAALVRLGLAAVIPIFPDEAYYWEWSRRLAAGYFDHPPAIALLIRLGGVLLEPIGASETPIGVRLGPAIAGLVAALSQLDAQLRRHHSAATVGGITRDADFHSASFGSLCELSR